MNPISCLEDKENIGVSECKELPDLIAGIITTPLDFSIAEADVNTLASWQNAIVAEKRNRIYLWPESVSFENASEDAVYEDTVLSTMQVRPGRYRFRLMFNENLELHKAMYSHNGTSGRVFLIDISGKIIGTTKNDGSFAGFRLDLLAVEKLMLSDGSVRTKTPVYISMVDSKELDAKGAQIQPEFLPDLVALSTANLTIQGTPTSTEIVVSVNSVYDNVPVLGLTLADFVLLDGAGVAQTITTVTDANDEGIYTLTGTGLVSGTLNLVAPSALSIAQPFEGKAVAVTI